MKTVTIVGVGALGSHVLQFLRGEDARFRIVDFDRVEQKNTLSQFHGRPSVRKSKVGSVKQSMQFLFGLKVEGIPHKLVSQNVGQLLGGSDLILDCLDNGEARRLVQGYVREIGIPCLHGALAADGAYGAVVWDQNFQIDDEVSGVPTCEDGTHLPFIALVSSFLARSAQRFLREGVRAGFHIHPGGRVILS
jgi:molybdopterin/thiamine biosynthesis adenylyltransferase